MLKLFNERGIKRGERVRVSGISGERDRPGRGKSGFEIGKAAIARGAQDRADVLLLLNDPTEAALISVHSKNPFTKTAICGGESTKKRSKEAEELLGMLEEIRAAGTDDGLEQFIATLLIRICVLSSSRFSILLFYMSAILAVLLSILHRLP